MSDPGERVRNLRTHQPKSSREAGFDFTVEHHADEGRLESGLCKLHKRLARKQLLKARDGVNARKLEFQKLRGKQESCLGLPKQESCHSRDEQDGQRQYEKLIDKPRDCRKGAHVR
ncbi:hypothetical protein SDC9_98873 [bioreactor metagenome]|uniref:Uncharacterized protein n=1 Tax=bioreactor metagenome TaxID=1076179 RepID=A0A645AGH4_9ZZZZ